MGNNMTITENIFRILEEKRISQKEFSTLTGIPQSTICDWKKKGKSPNSDKIATICNALDVTPYEIIDGIKKPDYVINEQSEKQEIENTSVMKMLEQTNDKVDRMMAYMVALNGLTERKEK